ncbi:hypothetical protein GJ744_006599 [Endocarpon pusillum]|uniref:Uncharacterized protein n=1 Tax=Endocarpon pusillum TaxID=364733 RepID=A0A8H7E9Y5_9EURO|nr:hypothetical protein GJ744_006599 [Endocarpon pusillum]
MFLAVGSNPAAEEVFCICNQSLTIEHTHPASQRKKMESFHAQIMLAMTCKRVGIANHEILASNINPLYSTMMTLL